MQETEQRAPITAMETSRLLAKSGLYFLYIFPPRRMRRLSSLIIAASLPVILLACTSVTQPDPSDDASSSASASESGIDATRNVRYTGTVEAAPDDKAATVSVLRLADGSAILLQSSDANLLLKSYIGKNVEVRGTAEPVGDRGTLLRVQELTVLDTPSSSADTASTASEPIRCGGFAGLPCPAGAQCTDDPTDDCDPATGGADCMGICVVQASASSVASSETTSTSASSTASSPVASASRSSAAPVSSAASSTTSVATASFAPDVRSADTELMAAQSYDDTTLWTQRYCTEHVGGFCVPVHKNWYYRSFGATTQNLWHVEFAMSAVDTLGQGAIVLNLVSGSAADSGLPSGQLVERGSSLVGAWEWNNNHFELAGDASLRPALEYMLRRITPYDPSSAL